MAYPLPYAFARSNELLLEDQLGATTLWLHASTAPSAVGEVQRCHAPQRLELLEREVLLQRISAAYAQGESSAATVASEVQGDVDLSRLMQELPAVEDLLET